VAKIYAIFPPYLGPIVRTTKIKVVGIMP
jgi:hypothetical protein